MRILSLGLLALLLVLTGCDSVGANDEPTRPLTLQMAVTSSATTAKTATTTPAVQQANTLLIEGSNGTLVIDDLRFIVEDFELERADGACEDGDDDDCEEIEFPSFFVDLPLDGTVLDLDTAPIETGLYEELEFEVDDLDLDDEDDRTAKEDLAERIYAVFPEWPDEASMIVQGTFTPAGGDAVSFTTYIAAEIEIEKEFEPPLELTAESAEALLRLNIAPEAWFTRPDGSLIDLSAFDGAEDDDLLELEVEMEDGFASIEVEEMDDDDDDDDEEDD